jgi:hypothetical protein
MLAKASCAYSHIFATERMQFLTVMIDYSIAVASEARTTHSQSAKEQGMLCTPQHSGAVIYYNT